MVCVARGPTIMRRLLLFWSIFVSIALVFYEFVSSELNVGPLMVLPMLVIGVIIFVLFAIVAVIALIVMFKKKNWLPILIQTVTIVLGLLVLPKAFLYTNFYIHKSERQSVVKLVEDGQLTPIVLSNPSEIKLPQKYGRLSTGGAISIEQSGNGKYAVLFYRYDGMLGNFTGYVYSPSAESPASGSFGGKIFGAKELSAHWYYVSSHG